MLYSRFVCFTTRGGFLQQVRRVCKREPKQEAREPVEVQKEVEVLELADSAEETTYIHPASKSRFGSQHKGLRSGQQQQQLQQERASGMTTPAYPSHCSHCEGDDVMNWQPHVSTVSAWCAGSSCH